MNKIDPKQAAIFIVVFLVIAVFINCIGAFGCSRRSSLSSKALFVNSSSTQPQSGAVIQNSAAPTKDPAVEAAAKAATEKAKFKARYLNGNPTRQSGKQGVAIVVAGEGGKLNAALNAALIRRLQTESVQIFPSFFTSQFVTDGLFDEALAGSSALFRKLDLSNVLGLLVLAREDVQYTAQGAALENVITATIRLDVTVVDIQGQSAPSAWTFTAVGPGFTKEVALAAAEERLLKQLANDTKMTLPIPK